VIVGTGALDSEMATETVLAREGLVAAGARKVALALVDRGLVTLEIVLAGECLVTAGLGAKEGASLLGVVRLFVGVEVEETSKAGRNRDGCKRIAWWQETFCRHQTRIP